MGIQNRNYHEISVYFADGGKCEMIFSSKETLQEAMLNILTGMEEPVAGMVVTVNFGSKSPRMDACRRLREQTDKTPN